MQGCIFPDYELFDPDRLFQAALRVNREVLERPKDRGLRAEAIAINNALHGQLDLLRGPDGFTEVRVQEPYGHMVRHNTVFGPETEMFSDAS